MNIGLYFGSFNPIHIGHLIIANHVLEASGLDKIWFVVSPQNPLKESASLLNEYDRLYLVELAVKDNSKFRASNVEFHLPKPSYTVDTLTYLEEKFPYEHFSVIMGSDSYRNLHHWKNFQQILGRYAVIVYERPGFPVDQKAPHPENTSFMEVPFLDISASYIRRAIQNELSIRYLVPDVVAAYIEENGYYRQNNP